MIKLSILMVRGSDLTYEQFIQHWGEVHGPLVAAQSESKQYVRRYIQDHRTSDALPGTTASNFDGIAEIWLPGRASCRRGRSPAGAFGFLLLIQCRERPELTASRVAWTRCLPGRACRHDGRQAG